LETPNPALGSKHSKAKHQVEHHSYIEWDELDLEKDVWVVPASRMKNRKEFLVPLTDPLKHVLKQSRELNGDQAYPFFTGRIGKYPHMNPSSINAHLI